MHIHNRRPIDALFVGYEDQENLGLRSIIATLEKQGFHTVLKPYIPKNALDVLSAVEDYTPDLVGFSIIFQYTLDEFAELTAILRQADVHAHFTVGGHFPSLRPREVLDALPHIDSVVRFEGELTTVELLHHLRHPEAWASIKGLAFRRGNEVVINSPRPLISDLDALPQPFRSKTPSVPRGIRVASILASRGCLYNCSFCSIRQFYGSAPGPLRRIRSPEAVVAEIRTLYERDGVRFFIFQDDDFAAKSQKQRQWIEKFLHVLNEANLTRKVGWKISCRVDDIDENLIARCIDHGLIAVYLGVESGNPSGLQTLNKRVTVEQNLKAIETLKRLGVAFDMGFMLFDPDSTIETIKENINFLRQVTADGTCPANFCKMLPYAGTPIEKRLMEEGRLKGTVSQPDYDFIDPRLDWYFLYVSIVFRFRNFDELGLVERLRLARFDQLLAHAFEIIPRDSDYKNALYSLTAKANSIALDSLENILRFVEARNIENIKADWPLLSTLANRQWQADIEIQYALDRIFSTYNPDLLRVFSDVFSRRFTKEPLLKSEFFGA
jgi:anaerobic magnesium-protoporphyrin IX monomethyl ester cyclase